MSSELIVALVGYLISLVSTLTLVKVEIANLKKQVEKHNSVIERTYKLEENVRQLNNRINNHEIYHNKRMTDKVK